MYDERPSGEERRVPAPKQRSWLSWATLALAALAAILAGAALYLVWRGQQEPEPPPEPETFQYNGQTLEVLEGMPTSEYSWPDFSVDERGRVAYQRDGRRAKTGVDVSFYQKDIDWQAVAADGIDFAIIRLGYRGYTEGGLNMDQQFERNLQGALDAGLEVGVYFFSQAVTPQEAEEEADYILAALDGAALAYPIAFDWEPITSGHQARTEDVDGQTLTRCAAAFCARIQGAGYEAAVYFNQNQGYFSYDLRELTDYTLWLAEYDTAPDFYYCFDLWQYTHTGAVAGIEGDVDLNLDLNRK